MVERESIDLFIPVFLSYLEATGEAIIFQRNSNINVHIF